MQETITQETIDQVAWYHEFDFGNGLKTKPTLHIDFHRKVWEFIETRLDAIDFKGKTVLDIGCWDGYWSFYAEKRGASQVLASDDVTQNWASGNGLRLARQLLGSEVEVNQQLPIYELASLGRRFDIVLCLGIYYHLVDPFYALAQIRHACHEGSVVVLEGDGAAAGVNPQGSLFDLSNHSNPIFVPTTGALSHMCEGAYLSVQSQDWMTNAAAFWAQATPEERAAAPRPAAGPQASPGLTEPLAFDRLFTVCRAFSGENKMHYYRPPFGLHAYDDRFKDGAEKLRG
jgi:tRNA (mo5U34)-methyltransferase